jgi:DNA-binding transcriptional regulator GbsR (MarR family)
MTRVGATVLGWPRTARHAETARHGPREQMPSDDRTPATTPGDADGDAARRDFVEQFAVMWELAGSALMDGRILGYLMMMREPYVSSADLGSALSASAGSVSMSTRRLVDSGFIKRHVVPGDRSHYFRAEDDVWGSWLAGERRYLDRQRITIEQGLAVLDPADERDEEVRRRLVNGRDYMAWISNRHREMLADWQAFKADRDDAAVDRAAVDRAASSVDPGQES